MTTDPFSRPISRRSLLRGALASSAGIGALAIVGCGSDDAKPAAPATGAAPTQASSPTAMSAATAEAPRAWFEIKAENAPPPRRDHSLTYHPGDGAVYAFGGRTAGTPNDELWA